MSDFQFNEIRADWMETLGHEVTTDELKAFRAGFNAGVAFAQAKAVDSRSRPQPSEDDSK